MSDERKNTETRYERNKRAQENLARNIAGTGVNSERAAQKAAEVARETDRKKSGG